MIQTISPYAASQSNPSVNQALSSNQSEKLGEILSNYDTKNLDSDAAKKIVTEINEAGINSGAGLTNALAENGIDAHTLGNAAGVGGPPAGGPPAGGPPAGGPPSGGPAGGGPPVGAPPSGGVASVDEAVVSLFEEAASIYEADETGQTFADIVTERLESEGMNYNQSLVDFRA